MTLCPEPHSLGLTAVFLFMMECAGVYYKPCFSAGDGGPKDMHLANSAKTKAIVGERFFFLLSLY